jgi:hypothetical protein
MTAALKAAVREAWNEIYGNLPVESAADKFTSALARRGVVVVQEEQSAELVRLCAIEAAARNVADTLNGGFIRCERCGEQETTTDIDYARELYAALQLPQQSTAPSESPAPKPARKVEFTQNHEALLLEIGKAAQTLVWGTRHMHGLNDAMKPFAALPIPQPGDEQ